MGLFDRLFGRQLAAVHIVESAPKFMAALNIDPWMVQGSADTAIPYTAPLSREQALQIPAVVRARDLMCGAIGQFPLILQAPNGAIVATQRALLDQPEIGTAAAVSMANLVEDMLFHEVGWWRTTGTYQVSGRPTDVLRLPPENVNVQKELVKFPEGMALRWPDVPYLIRFDSPKRGLLDTGRRSLRALARLEAAALKYTAGTPMQDHFEATDGVDPEEEDVREFLSSWEEARNASATGFVPSAFKYVNDEGPNAEQMQLVAARQFAITEVSRLTGISPEDLAVPVTSRTYQNMQDRRRSFVEDILGPFLRAIEQRLSMNDISPAGHTVRFDTSAFIRLDDAAAATADKTLVDAKIITRDEARDKRGLPPLPPEEEPAELAPVAEVEEEPETGFTLTAPAEIAFRVNRARRTIHGLAVPYGVASSPDMITRSRYRFKRGDLTWPETAARVPFTALLHDEKAQVGVSVAFTETETALYYTAYVAPGPDGDAVLDNADASKGGTWRGLSVGLGKGGKFRLADDGVYESEHPSPIVHVTITPSPAFEDSRVLEVAASAAPDNEGGPQMGDTQAAETLEAAFTTEGTDVLELAFTTQTLDATPPAPEKPAEPEKPAPATPPAPEKPEAPAFTGEGLQALTEAMTGLTEQLTAAEQARVDAPGSPAFASAKVDEEPLYRFDGLRGKREFSTDIKAAFTLGDSEARQNLQEFLAAAFAVTQAGVSSVNPQRYRPELYVDYIEKAAPVYTAIYSGGLSDNTPFVIPKFGSANGLVGNHTEGVEPTPGTFTTTSQTVTPTPVSGRAEIPREIIDAGGNPQVSGLIWRQMNRAYAEALEAEAAAVLNAATVLELEAALTASTSLAGDLNAQLAGVPFIDGGDLMDFFLGHVDLYKALGGEVDGTGRPMFPTLSPSNAAGRAAAKFRRIDVDGWELVPAKTLGATAVNSKTYLGYSDAVHVWNSAPAQIQYEQVANVNIGLFGYKASAVTQSALLRKITY